MTHNREIPWGLASTHLVKILRSISILILHGRDTTAFTAPTIQPCYLRLAISPSPWSHSPFKPIELSTHLDKPQQVPNKKAQNVIKLRIMPKTTVKQSAIVHRQPNHRAQTGCPNSVSSTRSKIHKKICMPYTDHKNRLFFYHQNVASVSCILRQSELISYTKLLFKCFRTITDQN